MSTAIVGPNNLHFGDVPPDEMGAFYLDLSGANPRLKVQWQDGGLGNAPVSIVDGLASSPLAYSDGTVPGGNTVANNAAPTNFASSYTIPANRLAVGSVIRVSLRGDYGTDAVPPTLSLRVMLGAQSAIITGSLTLSGALSGRGWQMSGDMIVTAIGASGSVTCVGSSKFWTTAIAAFDVESAVATATPDTTAALALTVQVTWGAADADNTITLRTMTVEILDT